MNIYGIVNGQAQLIQSNSLCIWHFERYEENGTLKSYIGFECTAQELIPENGEVIENFNAWMNEFESDEI
jgi:hypothetical protein